MKYVVSAKRDYVSAVYNTDIKEYVQKIPRKSILRGLKDGLYIYDEAKNKLREIELTEGKYIVKEEDYKEMIQILGADVITYSNRGWMCFNIKKNVGKIYNLGDKEVANLAYEIIEFPISEDEYKRYKLNLISYNNGIAKAYRYKFTFYYMMNSNKSVSDYELHNYTKDLITYIKYNPQCEIVVKSVDNKIIDNKFI